MITLVSAPTAISTTTFAQPSVNYVTDILNAKYPRAIIKDGYILAGTLLSVQGSMYYADSDTAITGTESDYVEITVSSGVATAAYVSSLPTVTYDSEYGGYYDTSGNLYLFNELDAISDGYITDRYFTAPPDGTKDLYTAGDLIVCAANKLSTTSATGALAFLSVSKGGFVRISVNFTKIAGNLS